MNYIYILLRISLKNIENWNVISGFFSIKTSFLLGSKLYFQIIVFLDQNSIFSAQIITYLIHFYRKFRRFLPKLLRFCTKLIRYWPNFIRFWPENKNRSRTRCSSNILRFWPKLIVLWTKILFCVGVSTNHKAERNRIMSMTNRRPDVGVWANQRPDVGV